MLLLSKGPASILWLLSGTPEEPDALVAHEPVAILPCLPANSDTTAAHCLLVAQLMTHSGNVADNGSVILARTRAGLYVVTLTMQQPCVVIMTRQQPCMVRVTMQQPCLVTLTMQQPCVVTVTMRQPSVVTVTTWQPVGLPGLGKLMLYVMALSTPALSL